MGKELRWYSVTFFSHNLLSSKIQTFTWPQCALEITKKVIPQLLWQPCTDLCETEVHLEITQYISCCTAIHFLSYVTTASLLGRGKPTVSMEQALTSAYTIILLQTFLIQPIICCTTISISNSFFIGNVASFGGGLSTFTASISYNQLHAHNHFRCVNCQFKRNTARGGAAVNIGRDIFRNDGSQYIMIPWFEDSIIENNTVVFDSTVADGNTQSGASDGNGAFFVSEVDVTFAGTTNFTKNNGTALYLDSTAAIFKNGTVYFIDNSGYQGGAILLFGKSDIYVDDGISFYFLNNTATKFGGAICALTGGKHVFSYMNSCFLKVPRYAHLKLLTNLHFYFHENTATIGNDIYATSIASCNMLCSSRLQTAINDTSPFFNYICYGNFKLSNLNISKCVATSPINIIIDFQVVVMPGIAASLNITQFDEVGGNVSQLFPLTAKVQTSRHNAKVDSAYTVITKNSIILLGITGDEGHHLCCWKDSNN